tara:strand:+ start:212 stop:409 length:198 start_codon:yes stop_codon:yes gene_type:complete
MIWKVLGILFIVGMAITAWALYTAPLMPNDYDLRDEDIWPAGNLSNLDDKTLNELVDEQYANEKD